MFNFILDLRKLSVFALLIFFSFLNSGCSDFRQAIGKEKFIPNEYSFLSTPKLIMPPEFGNTDNIIEKRNTTKETPELSLKNKDNKSGFDNLFNFLLEICIHTYVLMLFPLHASYFEKLYKISRNNFEVVNAMTFNKT